MPSSACTDCFLASSLPVFTATHFTGPVVWFNSLTAPCPPLGCAASSCVGAAKADHYLRGEIPRIIEFANSIARESDNLDDTVVRNCVNLLGDVCTVIPNVGGAFNNSSKEWEQLMVYCQDSGHLLGDTEWAISRVRSALQQG